MDDKPYKSISDLYAYLDKHANELDEKDISYMLGVLKTLKDLYGPDVETLPEEGHSMHPVGPSAWQRVWRWMFDK